ncbi:MAG: ribonuclease R family protein [Planctomycetota bacterium]
MSSDDREALKQRIRDYFSNRKYQPLDTRELSHHFEVETQEQGAGEVGARDDFVELLLELEEEGAVALLEGRGWFSPQREGWEVGRLTIGRRGHGFVRPTGGARDDDLFVAEGKFLDAHDGDLVLVKPLKPRGVREKKEGGRRGAGRGARKGAGRGRAPGKSTGQAPATKTLRREVRILSVLRRSDRIVPGTYLRAPDGRGGIVMPLRHEHVREMRIVPGRELTAKPGQRVLARLIDEPAIDGLPPGEVVELAAAEWSYAADLQAICAEFGIGAEFSPAARAEAAALPATLDAHELERRADLRALPIITVDPADARDFDDAVLVTRLPDGGFELCVCVADVSHFVGEGSALDADARERGTSVYLPARVFPMLPERLSNDLCSLRPDCDRAVKAVWMQVTGAGELAAYRVEAAVMRSVRRFTYAEVQALLDGEPPRAPSDAVLVPMLRDMNELRGLLHARRLARGAIELELAEQRLVLDAAGDVSAVRVERRDPAHHLIEEFMLLANEAVARIATARRIPLIRRSHSAPDEDAVARFLKFCSVIIPGLRVRGIEDFQRIIDFVRGRPAATVVNSALLRTLSRAEYCAEKSLHFALANDEYCHFTSPIRRYPDLQVHRAFDQALLGERRGHRPRRRTTDEPKALEALAAHCSATERNAEEAEREMVKMRLVAWLRGRVGEVFPGLITAVFEYGMYVQLEGLLAEGLVHVSTLEGDYFLYNEAQFALRGRNTGRGFRIGELIEVELVRADPLHRQLDLRYVRHRKQPSWS